MNIFSNAVTVTENTTSITNLKLEEVRINKPHGLVTHTDKSDKLFL
jgi:hypothetical protein